MEWDPQNAARVLLLRGFSSPASSGMVRCDYLSSRCRNYHMGVTVWGAQLGFCVHVCVKKGLRKPHLKDGTVKQWWSLKWATRSLWVKALQPHTLASDDYCQIDHFKVPNVLGIKPSCLNAWHVAQKNELRPDATFACAWFSIMSAEFSFFFFCLVIFLKTCKKGLYSIFF